MNKLILVGNGFDLAHALPTSYTDFINYFWKNFKNNFEGVDILKFVYMDPEHNLILNYGDEIIENYEDVLEKIKGYSSSYGLRLSKYPEDLNLMYKNSKPIFSFVNEFFKIITEESVVNWVDIENVYYEILKDLAKKSSNRHKYTKNILELNKEFEEIKSLLEKYLNDEILDKHNFKKNPCQNDILDLFEIKYQDLQSNRENNIFYEFPKGDYKELIEFDSLLKEDEKKSSDSLRIAYSKQTESLFLDFNYTNTAGKYVNMINSTNFSLDRQYGRAELMQIHGKINSEDNKINFGFGDEMDDDYKLIENTGDNNYLKNIKSFQYLHTPNYRKLLNWIESEKFQVMIFGHSCGLSDRTLLNTIFENENCRSIKIYYHEKDGRDNYTELTQNISRHFNKKALMRTKIVDKTHCSSLPQNVRFQLK